MARKRHDPDNTELRKVLTEMLAEDIAIGAREVVRRHSSIKNASDITRSPERKAILDDFAAKQAELRKLVGKVKRTGTAIAASELQKAKARIAELEAGEAARIESHLAMISAMAQLGGTAKLQMFYSKFAVIRDELARQGALPASMLENVRPLTR